MSNLEAILYAYVTNPDAALPNPLAFLDEAPVYWTANHGPSTPEEADHILNTPRLLKLLTEIWEETPPTRSVVDRCNQYPQGRQLLTNTRKTQSSANEVGLTEPTQDDIDTLVFNFEAMLTITATSGTLTFRGGPKPSPNDNPAQTRLYPADNHPDVKLHIKQTTDPATGQSRLSITVVNIDALKTTRHTNWTLTATLAHPHQPAVIHTDTQTITGHASPTWNIPIRLGQTLTTLTLKNTRVRNSDAE